MRRLTPMPALVEALRQAFRGAAVAPARHVHEISPRATLLLMPAWRPAGRLGVKVATVHPRSPRRIMASYLLIDGEDGRLLALIDGAALTARRTAAASALAADYLARPDAETLLMVGAGALAPHLIEAHASVRALKRVLVWSRDTGRAADLARTRRQDGLEVEATADLEAAAAVADIVSAATSSTEPLIRGAWLRDGTHLDLVGSHRHDMREADTAAIRRARVFVDTREGALAEAGELIQAIAEGAFAPDRIRADLAELCLETRPGRGGPVEITLFKSVGAAIEDLAAAELVYDGWNPSVA